MLFMLGPWRRRRRWLHDMVVWYGIHACGTSSSAAASTSRAYTIPYACTDQRVRTWTRFVPCLLAYCLRPLTLTPTVVDLVLYTVPLHGSLHPHVHARGCVYVHSFIPSPMNTSQALTLSQTSLFTAWQKHRHGVGTSQKQRCTTPCRLGWRI